MLLVRRSPTRELDPGVWDFPGGHSEAGETPEETLTRELGIVATHCVDLLCPTANVEELPVHFYRVKRWTGRPRNLQEQEHSEMAWVDRRDVSGLELVSPAIPQLIEAAMGV